MSGAIHAARTARRRVMRAAREARAKKWRFDRQQLDAIMHHLQSTQHQVEAEVGEFIQSPHLLFQPLRLGLALAIPMLVPLCFMPTSVLVLYSALVFVWYFACVLIFATEVAMRPPWYKKGLPTKEQPPYYNGCVNDPRTDLGLHFESVHFPSPVIGTTLRAWFLPPTASAPVHNARNMVVFVHGVGRDRRSFLRHAHHFVDAGYPCLLFDFSEHGLSDNVTEGISRGTLFGAREQHDVIAAVDFLKKEKAAAHVAIIGTSCGASSAILAASRRPDLAACVVAENPFTRADDLLRHHMHALSQNYLSQNQHQIVRRFVFWLAGKVLMIRMGYFMSSYGAIDAVSSLTCPLLVAHSAVDDVVPYEHGTAIYEQALKAKNADQQMIEFSSFPDAAHCALYDKDPQRWTNDVLSFVDKSFKLAEQRSLASSNL